MALAAAAALAFAPSARAGLPGFNLYWEGCANSGLAGISTLCNSNTSNLTLVCSMLLGLELHQTVAASGSLLFKFQRGVPPPWWEIHGAGDCRDGAAQIETTLLAGSSCLDAWGPNAHGQIDAWSAEPGHPGWRRLHWTMTIPPADSFVMQANQEYVMAKIAISLAGTTGAGACDGCTEGTVITFDQIEITCEVPRDIQIELPAGSNTVEWQNGPLPVKSRTWGAIKSLYR